MITCLVRVWGLAQRYPIPAMKFALILTALFLKISEAANTGYVFSHSLSKTCLAPKGLSPHPAEGTVVIHTSNCRDLSALFRILDNGAIQHEQSGLCIHLSGNRKIPRRRDIGILMSDCTDSGYFFTYTNENTLQLNNMCLRPKSSRKPAESRLVIYLSCNDPISDYMINDIIKGCDLSCLGKIVESKQNTNSFNAFFAKSEEELKSLSSVSSAFISTLKSKVPELYKDMLSTFFPVDSNVVNNLKMLVQHFGWEKTKSFPSLLLAVAFNRRHQGVNISRPAPCGGTNRIIGGEPAIDENDAEYKLSLSKKELAVLLDDEDYLAQQAIDNEREADEKAGINTDEFHVSMVQKLIDHLDAKYYYKLWTNESLKASVKECGVSSASEIRFPPRGAGMTGIEALEYLLSRDRKLFQQDSLNFPWPLSIALNIEAPLRQCNWIWRRLENGERIVRYSRYTSDYGKKSVACKESDWNICSVPRIIEDGGVCGRQSTLRRITDHCFGIPAGGIKQPGHAAGFNYIKTGTKYGFKLFQGITNMMNTYSIWYLTDNAMKAQPKINAEFHQGLANAMNHGYESYRNGRIALLLYSRIYNITMRHESRDILIEALENNPHMMDIWMKLIHDVTGINAFPKEGQTVFQRIPQKCPQHLTDSQWHRLRLLFNKYIKSYMQMYLEVLLRLIAPPSWCSEQKPKYLDFLSAELNSETKDEVINDYLFDAYLSCAAKSSEITEFLNMVQKKLLYKTSANKILELETFTEILLTLESLIKSKEMDKVQKHNMTVIQFYEVTCDAFPRIHVTKSAWIVFPQYRECVKAQLKFLNSYFPSKHEMVLDEWNSLKNDSKKATQFWIDKFLKGWLYGRSGDIVPLLVGVKESINGGLIVEVEVKVNVAKTKTTAMSTTSKKELSSDRAVDGKSDHNIAGGSCASTTRQNNPWFRVDLEKPTKVYGLLISNAEGKSGRYLQSFEIHIGNNLENEGTANPKCGNLHGIRPGETRVVYCYPPLIGQYVTINIPGNGKILTLCEIEVYNTELENVRAHGVKLEIWYNIGTKYIQKLYDDPRYPNNPDEERVLDTFDYNKLGNKYGSRLSALYQAPESGNFTFYAACTDQCEVFLRPVDGERNLEKIISLLKATRRNEWNRYDAQKSKPIPLEKRKLYELEATLKEHGGQDYITLATETPSGAFVASIPSQRLFIDMKTSSNVNV